MRKSQLIAAIEERRQGGGSGEASPVGRDGGGLRAVAAQDTEPAARQHRDFRQLSPAAIACGAGADRTFEQDAMESQTSTQPGLGGMSATGIGETHAADAGIGVPSAERCRQRAPRQRRAAAAVWLTAACWQRRGSTAVNGTPRDDAQQSPAMASAVTGGAGRAPGATTLPSSRAAAKARPE